VTELEPGRISATHALHAAVDYLRLPAGGTAFTEHVWVVLVSTVPTGCVRVHRCFGLTNERRSLNGRQPNRTRRITRRTCVLSVCLRLLICRSFSQKFVLLKLSWRSRIGKTCHRNHGKATLSAW